MEQRLQKSIFPHIVKKLPPFMEAEGSLTCLQQSATAPILRQIKPVHIIKPYFPRSILILSSPLRLGLQGLFLSGCLTKFLNKVPKFIQGFNHIDNIW
jgi:hypothetical protein